MAIEIPSQTPLFYSLHESRYSRQELICRIQGETKRTLIIYIANLSHPGGSINRDDILAFGDLLEKIGESNEANLDLLLQSPGGDIDLAEKIVYLCRNRSKTFRVIVVESAKSATTLIALAADSIVMGDTSELGPIDPQVVITTPTGNTIARPAQSFLDGLEFIKESIKQEGGLLSPAYYPLLQHLDPAVLDFCNKAIKRSKDFAKKWLEQYMLKDNPSKAKEVAEKISDTKKYLSHGAVINAKEAKELGLKVEYYEPNDNLWKALWRLYCAYETEIRNKRLIKIFESDSVSIPLV